MEGVSMKTRTSAFALPAILALVWWGLESGALFGQSKMLTTDDLTFQADVVAVGNVTAMKAEWNTDRTRIVTRVTVSVREYLKGGGETQMSILTPGGEIGEIGEMYSGAVRFTNNEEVVVFVKRGANRELRLTGGAQGKATITRDKTNGAMMVGPDMKLEEFVSNVKTALQAQTPEGR
jgi:hypothetical protein